MAIVPVFDAIHANVSHLPANHQAAGYVTGSSDIRWNSPDWAAHPKAVRIDQSPTASVWDETADVDDFENGAVDLGDLAPRALLRKKAVKNVQRPGQRMPAVYMSASNVSAVVNALVNGGIRDGVGLWVAEWSLDQAEAITAVTHAAGPFPIIGVQYSNGPFFDYNVFSGSWLNNVSKHPDPLPPVPADWQDHSGWVNVKGTRFYFNHNLGTLGYQDGAGNWHRVKLP